MFKKSRNNITKMAPAPRISTSWSSLKLDKSFVWSRASIVRAIVGTILLALIAYLLWLPIFYVFSAFHGVSSYHQPMVTEPGEE
jgi:hypothetical protein